MTWSSAGASRLSTFIKSISDNAMDASEHTAPAARLIVERACEADLDEIEEMVDDFVRGHLAEHYPRSREKLRAAYFGSAPVAHLLVARRGSRAIGMAQWKLIYDMFWGFFGAEAEWLYVRPEHRGTGVVLSMVAEICAQARCAGAEFLHGGGDDAIERLYERVAIGRPTNECHLSAEAFQVMADLAGVPPREIVRRLPRPELNRVAARSRG